MRATAMLALAGQLAVACSLLPQTTPIPVDTSFSDHEPCAPPCWHGLVPDQSTGTEVRAVLSSLPFVRGSRELSASWDGDDAAVSIYWFCIDGAYCGELTISADMLVQVALFFHYEVTLQEAVASLGIPSGIAHGPYHPEAGGCSVRVDWSESAVWVEFTDTRDDAVCDALDSGARPPRDLALHMAVYGIPDQSQPCALCLPWPGFDEP